MEPELSKQLSEILSGDRELLELSERLNKFNVFRILKSKHYEIRHSNMLAWLLNPTENHGLGDKFLRHFIASCLFVNQDSGVDFGVTATDIQLASVSDVKVFTERKALGSQKRFDLLIEIPSVELIIVIENKIHSGESQQQLNSYHEAIRKEYLLRNTVYDSDALERIGKLAINARYGEIIKSPEKNSTSGWVFIGIFLTLDGHEPSESKNFIPFSYPELRSDLDHLLKMNSNIALPARSLISNYLDVLNELTQNPDDEEIMLAKNLSEKYGALLAKIKKNAISNFSQDVTSVNNIFDRIYSRHQMAIDLVLDVGDQVNNDLIKSIICTGTNMLFLYGRANISNIIPREWLDIGRPGLFDPGFRYPDPERPGELRMPIVIWFSHAKSTNKLGVIIEVGPSNDSSVRKIFMEKIDAIKHEAGLRNYSWTEKSVYTRIYSKYLSTEKGTNEEIFRELWYGIGNKGGADRVVEYITTANTSSKVN